MRMQWWCNNDIHEEAWSASLIAREHVAVAVGNPSGVYQYLVSFPTISSLSLLFGFQRHTECSNCDIHTTCGWWWWFRWPDADQNDHYIHPLSWWAGNTASALSINSSSFDQKWKRSRNDDANDLQPVWFFGEQLVVLPNHCWTVFWIKLPEWLRMDDGVDQVYHHSDHQDPCHG